MSDMFNAVLAETEKAGKRLNQHVPEWRAFLEYAHGYFSARRIDKPVVVEIGILDGAQKSFYEHLLGAEYIGVDSGREDSMTGKADIVGDSRLPETLQKLKDRLAGRSIDLLFIDGLHTLEGVKSDYEMYGPLTKHIIALHDIHTPSVDVRWFWGKVLETNKDDTIITIQRYNPRRPDEFNGQPLGIGLIVKGNGA
jgi:hypothetical protein